MAEPDILPEVLILDGPTGTQLIERGFPVDPVVWTARAAQSDPALLRRIHTDYLRAGADIITANTFRASAYSLSKAGLTAREARSLAHATLAIATEAIEEAGGSRRVFLAGSLAPLEDCYKPEAVPANAVLEGAHAETAGWLAEGGCDLVLVETMATAREALAAVKAARQAGLAVAVSFLPDEMGEKLFGGDGLVETAWACVEAGAECVLVNCVHREVIERALVRLAPLAGAGAVIGGYGNAARMRRTAAGVEWERDSRPEGERAHEYAERAEVWVRELGARIVGSCCGTSPAYTRELARLLKPVV